MEKGESEIIWKWSIGLVNEKERVKLVQRKRSSMVVWRKREGLSGSADK